MCSTEEIVLDLGHLMVTNPSPIDLNDPEELERTLKDSTMQCLQELLNEVSTLDTEVRDDLRMYCLPDPITILPRFYQLPKLKSETRWEKFAKTKGIKNKKRDRMVWDEAKNEYKPRFGYKRANDSTDAWLVEHKQGAAFDGEDPFLKLRADKRGRIAKEKKKQVRNIVEAEVGRRLSPAELRKEAKRIEKNTASLGKFLPDPPKKKPGEKQKSRPKRTPLKRGRKK